MYCNRRYRGDGEKEEMSKGHVILIGQDNAGDCLIMSGDVPGGPEMDLGCHGYDSVLQKLMSIFIRHSMYVDFILSSVVDSKSIIDSCTFATPFTMCDRCDNHTAKGKGKACEHKGDENM